MTDNRWSWLDNLIPVELLKAIVNTIVQPDNKDGNW